jgi:hypothetical protein
MDDSIEINLRPARQVGQRLIALVAMLHRAELETRTGQQSAAELNEERFDLSAWLSDQQVAEALSPSEQRFLDARVGSLSEEELGALSSIQGSIEAIAWSLLVIDSLRADLDTIDIIANVPGPDDRVGAFLQPLALRPLAAIADAREESEIWAWRFDIELEARSENRAIHAEDSEVIRAVLNELADSGSQVESIDGDFVMDGFPVARVDTVLVEYAAAIEFERLRAFNWVCGYGQTWDDVPLEID